MMINMTAEANKSRRERRDRVVDMLREKGLDSDTISMVHGQFLTERAEATKEAVSKFSDGADIEDMLSTASRRCKGLLAAAIGFSECQSPDMLSGIIQLAEDLSDHLCRIEEAASATRWLDKQDGK